MKWLSEPLVQFVLGGSLLFVGYHVLHRQPDPAAALRRIEVTADEKRSFDEAWTAQWHRHPTEDEMKSLVAGRVREEILYREAVALGLDKDDSVVKRRMVQKMEFLADEPSRTHEPTAGELAAWFETHRERFAQPSRITFRHRYFSPDRRREGAREAAVRSLAGAEAGDPFMYQDYYADRTVEQLAAVFGSSFASGLEALPIGVWQGPIESGLGWHLVRIEAVTPSRLSSFDEVADAVKAEWIDEQRTEVRRKTFDAIKARYEVVLP